VNCPGISGGFAVPLAVGGDLLDRGQVRVSAETLRKGVRRAETDVGLPGVDQ
jgi:hypothetical protein